MNECKYRLVTLYLLTGIAALPAHAEVTGKVSLVSNYLSYGLSQTQDDPALQFTTTWSGESGLYISGWASQVDFGERTDTEVGVYAGYYKTFSDTLSLDAGIAQFLYEGTDISDDYNYNEVYATFHTSLLSLGLHYAWDYFGSGAEYTIVQASKKLPLAGWFTLTFGVDYSLTGDEDKYSILGESDYLHYFIRAEKDWIGLQWSLSVHETSMPRSETDEARAVAGIGYAF